MISAFSYRIPRLGCFLTRRSCVSKHRDGRWYADDERYCSLEREIGRLYDISACNDKTHGTVKILWRNNRVHVVPRWLRCAGRKTRVPGSSNWRSDLVSWLFHRFMPRRAWSWNTFPENVPFGSQEILYPFQKCRWILGCRNNGIFRRLKLKYGGRKRDFTISRV